MILWDRETKEYCRVIQISYHDDGRLWSVDTFKYKNINSYSMHGTEKVADLLHETGLKDKNGAPIFENHVVLLECGGTVRLCVVKYEDSAALLVDISDGEKMPLWEYRSVISAAAEVVGVLYEKPDYNNGRAGSRPRDKEVFVEINVTHLFSGDSNAKPIEEVRDK